MYYDKMQLTTKNCLNRMKNKGVMAGYVKYANSGYLAISIYTYALCIHTKIHANWSISQGDIIKKV